MNIKLTLSEAHEEDKILSEIDLPFLPPVGSIYEHALGSLRVTAIHFSDTGVLLKLRFDFDDTE